MTWLASVATGQDAAPTRLASPVDGGNPFLPEFVRAGFAAADLLLTQLAGVRAVALFFGRCDVQCRTQNETQPMAG